MSQPHPQVQARMALEKAAAAGDRGASEQVINEQLKIAQVQATLAVAAALQDVAAAFEYFQHGSLLVNN